MAFLDRFKWGKKKAQPEDEEQGQRGGLEESDSEPAESPVEFLEADSKSHYPGEGLAEDLTEAVAEELSEEDAEGLDEPEEPVRKTGIFERLKKSLGKTRENIGSKIDNLVKRIRKVDEEFYEELEEILIQADVGFETSMEIVDRVRSRARKEKIVDSDGITAVIRDEIQEIMEQEECQLADINGGLTVIMVVGVNGSGKTTSIGKLAYKYKSENKKVMLAAADTFRAAAIDQLQIWAERTGVEIVKHKEGSDPGAVVFDAVQAAQARKMDVLIIDTAGRLQNKTNLMKELTKVWKIIDREIPGAPHETLLVIDATTGQNAVSQAKVFKEATSVSGIILTKLDGTARGGIVIAIARELQLPVKLVGTGEKIDDLADFSPSVFASEVLGSL